MRVCFVKIKTDYMEYPFSDPPLGLLYVASAIEKEGFDTLFFDTSWETEIPEADIYCFSSTSMEYEKNRDLAIKIKEQYPKAFTILGGVHATVFGRALIGHLNSFDIVFCGEGESLPKVLRELEDKGVVSRVIFGKRQTDLNILSFPARHFLRKDLYFDAPTVFMGKAIGSKSGTIITSRGCPFSCSFCCSPNIWGQRTFFRSSKSVLAEVDELIEKYGVSEIRFQDDNFTLNRQLEDICIGLSNRKVFWRCSTRADLLNRDLLKLLWKGGCREIGIGIESAEDSVLDLINKKESVTDYILGTKWAREIGFRVRIFIMTGLPGETGSSADKMIALLATIYPDVVTLCTFIPIPGSDIYRKPEKYNGKRLLGDNFSSYDFALKWEKEAPFGFLPDGMTLEMLEENREKLKTYIFNKRISNVFKYNRSYP